MDLYESNFPSCLTFPKLLICFYEWMSEYEMMILLGSFSSKNMLKWFFLPDEGSEEKDFFKEVVLILEVCETGSRAISLISK